MYLNKKHYYNNNNNYSRKKHRSRNKKNKTIINNEENSINTDNIIEKNKFTEDISIEESTQPLLTDNTSELTENVIKDEIPTIDESLNELSKYNQDTEIQKYEENTIEHEVLRKKNSFKYYIGYYGRLTISLIILLFLLTLTVFFVFNIFDVSKENYFSYSEHSNLDYKVYLKENNFYEEEYLPKDMLYVANLIDNININFSYKFISEKNIDLDFKYNINAKLLITDFNDKNIYYEKSYNLVPEKNVLLKNGSVSIISEGLDINYDEYNKIANNFKSSYGLSTKSKLIVYFNIDKSIVNKTNAFIDNPNNNMYLEIPLSEKSVDIELNCKDINNKNKIILNKKNDIKINKMFTILSFVSLVLFIVVLFKVIKYISYLFSNKNVYDEYIEKLLNEYDRLIVKTVTPPFNKYTDKDKIIKVENFDELLDVRDNLKQPIMYYVVTKHVKCHFYINNGEKIYITTIKKVDLEAEYEKE